MITKPNYSLDNKLLPCIINKSWVPISRLSTIPDKCTKHANIASVFGDPRSLSIVKNDGYFVINDCCPHRNARMYNIKVEDDTITCPYHSAVFNLKTNECVDFLGCSDSDMKLESFPTHIDDGVLFVNLSGEDIIPPTILQKSGRECDERIVRGQYDVDSGAFDVMENLLDVAHLPSTHKFGNKKDPLPFNTKRFSSSNTFTYDYKSGLTGETLRVSNGFDGPFSVFSHVNFGESYKRIRIYIIPISESKSRLLWSMTRNFMTLPQMDTIVKMIMYDTITEDANILKTLDPLRNESKQILTKLDWPVIRYRKYIQNMIG